MKPWTVIFSRSDWQLLNAHHYPGDYGEHGSVLACGVVETPRERRLLVREVLPAIDGKDYVASVKKHTHQLVAEFVSEKVGYCAGQKLAYIAVHNHGVGVEQYRRDLGVHDVAVHRPEGEERIHPQGEPARHVHFPCAREGLHLCVARERAHDAPQVHVLDHFIVDDDHLADAQVRDGLGQ